MTQEQPITPPPELVQQWQASLDCPDNSCAQAKYIATQAARWGADQELDACISAVLNHPGFEQPELFTELLHSARRPKLKSLKEQANAALGRFFSNAHTQASQMTQDFEIIRRAVEALPDD